MTRSTRDLLATRTILGEWLGARLPGAGQVTVRELTQAEEGMSGELLMCEADYEVQGSARTDGVVIRLEPSADNQLFLDTAFREQYDAMVVLAARPGAAVPAAIGFEEDASLLGSRFYAMARSTGRTGALWLPWMMSLTDAERDRTWWTGLEAMAELHRIEVGDELAFLHQPHRGADPVDQMLQYNWDYYQWVRDGEVRPVIEEAYAWLRRNKPDPLPPIGFAWGDAKRGNLLYDDDLAVSAVLDLEMMSLGPAEMDLAYWIEGEEQTAEALGVSCPGRDETVRRYADLIGRPLEDLSYYTVLAALRLAVLRVKLWVLREGEEFRGGKYDGDERLALVLSRHAGVPSGLPS